MPFRGTRWPRLAGNILSAGRTHQTQPHSNLSSPVYLESTSEAPSSRPPRVEVAKEARPSTLTRIPTNGQSQKEPNVDPDSLRNTLEAHREANRASLIVKIAGQGSIRQPLKLPAFVERREQFARSQGGTGRRHPTATTKRGRQRQRGDATPVLGAGRMFLAQWVPDNELRYTEKYPWMKHMKPHVQPEPEGKFTGIEQLSREIDAFYSYSQPNEREKRAAELALQDISAAIERVDQNIKIDVVGSRATGLALPMSDIDLNISTTSSSSNTLVAKSLLTNVARSLATVGRNTGLFRSLTTRLRPKIPLVTGRHACTHLEFQVQSTVDVCLSLQQTMSFINEFPTLRQLFVLLKQMLTMRGLNLGAEQGLSSYPLLVMIVAALKFSEGKFDRRDAGAHLIFFLDMYSDIDFTTTAISFSPLQYVIKRHPHSSTLPHLRSAVPAPDSVAVGSNDSEHENQDVDARRRFATIKPNAEFLMCLQDPANLQNDLGKAAYRIREVQTSFIRFREELRAGLKAWDDGGGNNKQDPLLASCASGDYRIYENTRHVLGLSISRMMRDFSTAD